MIDQEECDVVDSTAVEVAGELPPVQSVHGVEEPLLERVTRLLFDEFGPCRPGLVPANVLPSAWAGDWWVLRAQSVIDEVGR